MKVKELIEELKKHDGNLPIKYYNDEWGVYCNIGRVKRKNTDGIFPKPVDDFVGIS